MRYKILAPCQGILGLGLLMCGIMGSVYSSDSDSYYGPPYFLGGYFVGCLVKYSSESMSYFGPTFLLIINQLTHLAALNTMMIMLSLFE